MIVEVDAGQALAYERSYSPATCLFLKAAIMPIEAQLTRLTPEQIEMAKRMESIFMPEARRLRDATLLRQAGGSAGDAPTVRYVHYTTADAALNIIGTKRLWMRNTTCMDDYREVEHGFDIFKKYFNKDRTALFASALDVSVPGVAMEAIDRFNALWEDIRFNTYITSISEHADNEDLHGRLSMWRAFGTTGPRVAIVFKVPWYATGAQALNILFSPVSYLDEGEAHGVISEAIENIAKSADYLRTVNRQIVFNTVYTMLVTGVTCLKHEGFREEREWRAIYSPKLSPSPLIHSSLEVVRGVPQTVYGVPLDEAVSPALADLDLSHTFDRLIVGPSPYPWVMYEAFAEALKKMGVADAGNRVRISQIPIRS